MTPEVPWSSRHILAPEKRERGEEKKKKKGRMRRRKRRREVQRDTERE